MCAAPCSNGLHYCRYCIKDRKEERKRFETVGKGGCCRGGKAGSARDGQLARAVVCLHTSLLLPSGCSTWCSAEHSPPLLLQEWQFFREAKEVLFPRVQSRPALRSIQSGRRWEGTESFKESLESFKGSSVASGDSK